MSRQPIESDRTDSQDEAANGESKSADAAEQVGPQKQTDPPAGAWPGVFKTYRDVFRGSSEYPECYMWAAFAACFSVLLGRTVGLAAGPGLIYPLIFVCLVGATGRSRKSTAISDAIEAIVEKLHPRPSRGGQPPPFELVQGSGSGEGFCEALADQPWWPEKNAPPETVTGRVALFVVHEFGALLEKANRGQAGNMVEFLLMLFDARSHWTHRTRAGKESKPLTLTESFGVLLAATTGDWLAKTMTETQVMIGLANRILWFSGDSERTISLRPPIPPEKLSELQAQVAAVIRWANGRRLTLSNEAKERHHEWYAYDGERAHESRAAEASTSRADMLALRIAMLLAVAERKDVVGVEHIQTAWEIVECSNRTIIGIVEQLQEETPREAEARVLRAIRRHVEANGNSFTRRDIQQHVKGKTGMDSQTFARVFKSLVDAGVVTVSAGRYKLVS